MKKNVAVIVSFARESSEKILRKIQNTANLIYHGPGEMDVLLAFDSTDFQIVREVENKVIPDLPSTREREWQVVYHPFPQGKEEMQKIAMSKASRTTQFFVFTDCATLLDPNAVEVLMQHFEDPEVGVVDSHFQIVNEEGEICSEGLYLRYENWIRKMESDLGSIIGAGGCLFAASRDVMDLAFTRGHQSDFSSVLSAHLLGKKGIKDETPIAKFEDLSDHTKEYNRKYRTVLRGINTLVKDFRELLNPFNYGFFSFQLWSHKIAKWMVPFCLLTAFFSNCFLALSSKGYLSLLLLQWIFYIMAYLGLNSENKLFRIPTFFVMSNLAILRAWIDFFKGKNMLQWEVSQRK